MDKEVKPLDLALPYFAFFYFLPVFLFTPIVLFRLSLSLDLCTSFIPCLAINTDALGRSKAVGRRLPRFYTPLLSKRIHSVYRAMRQLQVP